MPATALKAVLAGKGDVSQLVAELRQSPGQVGIGTGSSH
jgi:hypothetical protein